MTYERVNSHPLRWRCIIPNLNTRGGTSMWAEKYVASLTITHEKCQTTRNIDSKNSALCGVCYIGRSHDITLGQFVEQTTSKQSGLMIVI